MAKWMGVDLGDVRTGVAFSDVGEYMATGYATLTEYSEERLLQRLDELAKKENAVGIVVGLPINMDGSFGERAAKAQRFADLLQNTTGLPVQTVDERLSTVVAHTYLDQSIKKGSGGKKRKQVVDTLSAEIILQSFLDKRRAQKGATPS